MPLALVVSVPSILLLFLLVAVSPSEVAQEIVQVGTASSSSATENSLTELTIIGTADGVLHAVDSEKDDGSGMLIWSLDTGGPTMSSHHADSLEDRDYSVIPATDGSILIHTRDGMRKTSVKARMLAEKAPFISDNLIFTGSKSSRILGVDMKSGRLLHDSGSGLGGGSLAGSFSREKKIPMMPAIDKHKANDRSKDILDFAEEYETDIAEAAENSSFGPSTTSLWFGRVDYTLRAFNSDTGTESFNMTFSELKPLHTARALATKTGRYDHTGKAQLLSLGAGKTTGKLLGRQQPKKPQHTGSLVATPEGDVLFFDSEGKPIRAISLNSPAVSAFNVQSSAGETLTSDSPHEGVFSGHASADVQISVEDVSISHRLSLGLEENETPASSSAGTSTSASTITALSPLSSPSTAAGSVEDMKAAAAAVASVSRGTIASGTVDDVVVVRTQVNGGMYAIEMDSVDDGISNTQIKLKTVAAQQADLVALPAPENIAEMNDVGDKRRGTVDDFERGHSLRSIFKSDTADPFGSVQAALVGREEKARNNKLKNKLHQNLQRKLHAKADKLHRLSSFQAMDILSSLSQETEETDIVNPELQHSLEVDDRHDDADEGNRLRDSDADFYSSGKVVLPVVNTLLQGSGRLCTAAPYKSDEVGRSRSSSLLPVCLDGHHRLLPYTDRALWAMAESKSRRYGRSNNGDEGTSGSALPEFLDPGTFREEDEDKAGSEKQDFADVSPLALVVLYGSERAGLPLPITGSLLLGHIAATVFGGKYTSSRASLLDRVVVSDGEPRQSLLTEELDEHGRKVTRVGSLLLSADVLGYGSHGTVVLKGSLNGRPVAIKRMLTQFSRAAEREISLLIRSDGHPNVVRYFLREQQGEFVYLALQLCKMSVRDFVLRLQRAQLLAASQTRAAAKAQAMAGKNPFAALGAIQSVGLARTLPAGSPKSPAPPLLAADIQDEPRRALQQVAEGVAHLHSQRIVHRDIKPHNILCALPDEATDSDIAEEITSLQQLGGFCLKISDMGLSKQLDHEEGSFASMSFSFPSQAGEPSLHSRSSMSTSASSSSSKGIGGAEASPVGTIGWQAPELMALRGTGVSVQEFEAACDEADEIDPEDAIVEVAGSSFDGSEKRQNGTKSQTCVGDDEIEDAEVSAGSHSGGSSNSSAGLRRSSDVSESNEATALSAVRPRRTAKTDIFSLGCVFHYVLVPGVHPFGQWFEREANIMQGRPDLSSLRQLPDAMDLISRMLKREPTERPSAAQVVSHPFFWASQRRLDFLVEMSDRLEHEPADSAIVLALETGAANIVGRSWDRKLNEELLEDMGRYRKYDTASVRDLLRVVRNKRHHFHELTEPVKALMGDMPAGFLSYFEERYPKLLMHCVVVSCAQLRLEKDFSPYCAAIYSLFVQPQNQGVSTPAIPVGGQSGGTALGAERTVGPSAVHQSVGAIAMAMVESCQSSEGTGVAGGMGDSTGKAADVDSGSSGAASNSSNAAAAKDVIVWHGSALATSLGGCGWWRDDSAWVAGTAASGVPTSGKGARQRPAHLVRSSTDLRYRSRLCTHWEYSQQCPMKKKGKCDFAHGPLELRVKESRRDKWGQRCVQKAAGLSTSTSEETAGCSSEAALSLRHSGGEDVLGAARSIEKVRADSGSVSEFEKTAVVRKQHGMGNNSSPSKQLQAFHVNQSKDAKPAGGAAGVTSLRK